MSIDLVIIYLAFIFILILPVLAIHSLKCGKRLGIVIWLSILHMVSLTLAIIFMLYYLVTRSFQIVYVASYTDRDLPLIYVVSALWAGPEGSLLFWSWILSVFITLLLRRGRTLALIGSIVISSINIFLTALLITVSNPFVRFSFTPQDGRGLNPLLQNPYMAIHPPLIFLGYSALSIPYGLAIAGLVTGDDGWINHSRIWALSGWIFLTLGIVLGAAWSYIVLGWGGYWAWDPVENSSLIPWISSTILLHSITVQRVRGMMRIWNIIIAILTFISIVLASFITRSGIIESIHAFASMNVGIAICWYMIVMLTISLFLLAKYCGKPASNKYYSLLSREFMVLTSITVFIIMVSTILWGTLYPLIIAFIHGIRVSVSSGFFENIFKPLFIVVTGLMGICSYLKWIHTDTRALLWKIFISTLLGLASLLMLGCSEYMVLAGGFVSGFTILSHIINIRKLTFRKIGFSLIHIGVALILLGYLVSSTCERVQTISLEDEIAIMSCGYTYVLEEVNKTISGLDAEYIALIRIGAPTEYVAALIEIPEASALLKPSIKYYYKFNTILATPDIWSRGWIDIYVSLHSITENSARIIVRFIPLVSLIWIGCIVMICGSLILLLKPFRHKETVNSN